MTTQQQANLAEAQRLCLDRSVFSSPHPPVLFLELTRNCLARCDFCRPASFVNSPSNEMPEHVLETVMQEYVPYASLVDLRGWGESLMLARFEEHLGRIHASGPRLRLVTTLGCGSESALRSLVDYGVEVSVTLDASTSARYESIRRGISFDTVMRNLAYLAGGMRDRYGSLAGKLRIMFAPLHRDNLPQLQGILELAARLGVPDVAVGPLGAHPNDNRLLQYHQQECLDYLSSSADYAQEVGLNCHIYRSPFTALRMDDRAFRVCCHPWLFAMITSEGKLSFCDHLLVKTERDKTFLLGDVGQPVSSVWNGDAATRVRQTHLSHQDLNWRCEKCYTIGEYTDFEHTLCPQLCPPPLTLRELVDSNSFRKAQRGWTEI